ncbi:MAG: transglycosylase SLT domain-containing protein [Bryobacterales bacterium]|nr:transglycosylase SLT domain-containing protein [Bryobacterales bacterium]
MRTGLLAALAALIASQTVPAAAPPLGAGLDSLNRKDYQSAISSLRAARKAFPAIGDYAAFSLAEAHAASGDQAQAIEAARFVRAFQPPSPMAAKAVLVEAGALLDSGAPRDAIQLLRDPARTLPEPDASLLLGAAYHALNNLPEAVRWYQRVYYGYPASDGAPKASEALAALRQKLGSDYPPAMPARRLERADALLAARQYARAKAEYKELAMSLSGPLRDMAAVRIGAADYESRATTAAFSYLSTLKVAGEAEAERLYYTLAAARRLNREDVMASALHHLLERHTTSPWRGKALVSAGNHYLLSNRFAEYEPVFDACADDFPDLADASYCHWKATWSRYLRRHAAARKMMAGHLERFPESSKASAALYYLGRLAEDAKNHAAARAYFDFIVTRYPGHYYAGIARQRLEHAAVAKAQPAEQVTQWLGALNIPPAPGPVDPEATPETRQRIERARLLKEAGAAHLATGELRYGAGNGAQAHLVAMELARQSATPHQSMRWMKSLVRDYFSLPAESAPEPFWRYLFPMPFEKDLRRWAGAADLDPHIVAGLIRQESEFDPRAVSRAKAYGLTQILPSTGRTLARRAGYKKFSTRMLMQPAVNLRLGTLYLRMLLNQWDGRWEETLASYNAGKSRVDLWKTWGEFREASEFIETIPFTETREYVQAVLRNAEVYRRLYSSGTSAAARRKPDPSS